jgi:hypothetical protein
MKLKGNVISSLIMVRLTKKSRVTFRADGNVRPLFGTFPIFN